MKGWLIVVCDGIGRAVARQVMDFTALRDRSSAKRSYRGRVRACEDEHRLLVDAVVPTVIDGLIDV